ncbi:hypothetical protein [Streptomyces sp. AM8-1-1]|uniref:hypothetical protein n=1 Tax=Streptomyces sp. AM8-1-1 TaxID=3075825 RepID=UPI0028C5068A|nr:hypothetical protein [Streptomyces sp. AM8-1-1]WNO70393.1 hypothetical protein RPQ07_01600 [Streptomyces sp. AM8-1-1]
MNTGRTGRTAVRGPLRTTIGTAVCTTVMDTGGAGRTTICGTFGATVGTTVMDTGRTGRTTVRRTFGTAVGTAIMNTGRTGRTAVRGPLRTAVSTAIGTAVMNTRCTGRATVRGPLLLVRILFGVSHHSSWESNDRDRAPQLASDRLTGDPGWALPVITVSLQDESLDSGRAADESLSTGVDRAGSDLGPAVPSPGSRGDLTQATRTVTLGYRCMSYSPSSLRPSGNRPR